MRHWPVRICRPVMAAICRLWTSKRHSRSGTDSASTTNMEFSTRVRASRFTTSTRSEEHTSELQSLMRTSYAVFCLKKKKNTYQSLIHINYYRQNNANQYH